MENIPCGDSPHILGPPFQGEPFKGALQWPNVNPPPISAPGEQIAGTVFFVIYLVVLPFATAPLFRLAERLLDASISPSLQNAIYYYTLFAVTFIIFHSFLGRTTRNFADNLGNACKSILVGLIALYGLNELVYRLTRMLVNNHTNLNDTTISAQIHDAPRVTLLIVIFLAPFVEEVLFRGLVFGNLKGKSRIPAREFPPRREPGSRQQRYSGAEYGRR